MTFVLPDEFIFDSYEDAAENFSWDDKWKLFDGSREDFNITNECIYRHERREPEDTAIRIQFANGERATYAFTDIKRQAAQFAHVLEQEFGVNKGDNVAVMLEPRLETYISMFGIWARGAVYVPMFTLFGPDAIKHRLDDSGADVLITNPEKADDVPDNDVQVVVTNEFEDILSGHPTYYEPTTEAEDIASIQYTSGTTGQPEGYAMKHKTLTNIAPAAVFGHGIHPTDRCFCTSPIAWVQGLWSGTVSPLMLGTATGIYSGKFDVNTVLAGLEQFEITNLIAAATALRQIENSGLLGDYNLSLKKINSGGEKIDTNTIQAFEQKTGVRIAEEYGMSEFGAITHNCNGFENFEIKLGSMGRPLPGLKVAVIDDDGTELPPGTTGEIAVWHNEQWLRTNDLGEMDEDGYFWHKVRKDDVIISAGYRIGPTEVEETLMTHPDVDEAVVVGVPNEERGNIVKAFIKSGSPETPELTEEIQNYVKDQLSKHEYPREIEFVKEFPRTESGKIKRKDLG